MSLLLTGAGSSGAGGPPPDPLAGISFGLRFETHGGDGVPQGLYTDVAGTVPAGQYDTVAAIRNWRGDNAITFTQATAAQQPTLMLDGGGFPYLQFDGIDDTMSVAVSAGSGKTTAALWYDGGGGTFQYLLTDDAATGILRYLVTLYYAGGGVNLTGVVVDDGLWHRDTGIGAGASSLLRRDGAQIATGNSGFNPTAFNLATNSAGAFYAIRLKSLFVYANSTGHTTTVETYESTL